jgi:S1-C subfamily serine protease
MGRGLSVVDVSPKGVAARAGVQKGDTVLELNGKDISAELFDGIDIGGQAGETVVLKVRREGVKGILYFEIVREAVNNS